MTTAYDKAAAFTNVVIVAGYAAFFGLWSLTKAYIARDAALWAALLMMISAGTFVFFEVYKMVLTQRLVGPQQELLKRGMPDSDASALLKELQRLGIEADAKFRTFSAVWYTVLAITVFTALCALGVIGYGFMNALLTGEILQPL